MAADPDLHADPNVYVPQPATLTKIEQLTELERYYQVTLDSGEDLGHMPGQFVQISVPGIGEAPISISSSPDTKGSFELVIRRIGRLTNAMHEMEEGASVGVRGPFGKGFPVDTEMLGSDIVFICGGIGLVPVRSAIQYVLQHRYDYGDVAIVYGTKTPAEQLFLGELAQWEQSEEVKFLQTVDRASPEWKKRVGVITTLIPELAVKSESTKVIVCGPPIMYKFVIMELSAIGIPDDQIYVSLERRMKCGVGRCGHCQINELYTCLDGPVFKYAQVKDAPEAI